MKADFFIEKLEQQGIDAYYGVPDSLLKSICAYITDHADSKHNIITANEGNAIGLACGHFLATGRPALVYMQNSGQGNCVNPLLSLMDEEVYSIPVLLLIGWRGEPGTKDEPQHVKQGKVTLSLLETMGIDYAVLSSSEVEAQKQVEEACDYMRKHSKPYALVVRKGTFEPYSLQNKRRNSAEMSREDAICTVAAMLSPDDIIISTTGQISRELYEYRERKGASHRADFLTVGGMGHASSIAMGVAINRPERRVICLDGDGAMLMHLGAAALIGTAELPNLRHIVLNNSAHDSVGGQPTIANELDLGKMACACGYKFYHKAETAAELTAILPEFLSAEGAAMLEIVVSCGSRSDLGRPKEKPFENKETLMRFAEEGKSIIAPGAFSELKRLVGENHWKSILLFCSERSRQKHEKQLRAYMEDCEVVHYSAISPNPTAEEVNAALACNFKRPDAIVALGGGSTIDFAKLYRAAIDNAIDIKTYFNRNRPLIRKTPMVAIPTTAGTGSEVTRFAVVYIDSNKYSLDALAVMPDYALVDSELMADAPAYLKASCGMDALAQAIEGYWARGATADSDAYALKAIELCRESLAAFVNTQETSAAAAMAEASCLAGKCISITRTTAAHALSYKITQDYGIPHGHAVALSLPGLAELHYNNAEEASILHSKMHKLAEILGVQNGNFRKWFSELYRNIGLVHSTSELGIISVLSIVNAVNTDRLANNPLKLTPNELMRVFFD